FVGRVVEPIAAHVELARRQAFGGPVVVHAVVALLGGRVAMTIAARVVDAGGEAAVVVARVAVVALLVHVDDAVLAARRGAARGAAVAVVIVPVVAQLGRALEAIA